MGGCRLAPSSSVWGSVRAPLATAPLQKTITYLKEMSHVFSVNCKMVWGDTTPVSAKASYDVHQLYPQALQNPVAEFPMDWSFALIRTIHKMCIAVESNDAGMTPIALFDVVSDKTKCTAAIRVRASGLAIKFLSRFLVDFDGWNDKSFYPTEKAGARFTYGGVARALPPNGIKNVCSSAFATLCKMTNTHMDDSNRRFWWTRVERIENLMFMWIVNRMRRDVRQGIEPNSWTSGVLTVLVREETRTLNKNAELRSMVGEWKQSELATRKQSQKPSTKPVPRPVPSPVPRPAPPKLSHVVHHVSEKQLSPAKTDSDSSSSYSSSSYSSASSPVSTRSGSPIPTAQKPPVLSRDLIRLRFCNFPPRMSPGGAEAYAAVWEPNAPCLSGVVFDPITNLPCAPRGMKFSKNVCMSRSIW